MTEIAGNELDNAFFDKLMSGNIFTFKDEVKSTHELLEDEIVEITARRAFEYQSLIQHAVTDLPRSTRKLCSKHYLLVAPKWWKEISKEPGEHKIHVCYEVICKNRKELDRLRKERKEKENGKNV